MMMIRTLAAALIGAGLAASPAHAGEGLTLRYKLEPGDSQIYETSSNMQQTQTIGDQKLQTSFTMKEVAVRTLQERTDDGDVKIDSENKRLSFEANIPQVGEYAYDSGKSERDSGTPLADELNKVFGRLDGATITFTLSPRGEVRNVSGFQELLADILKENPTGAQFVGGGTDEAHKLALIERLLYLPENAVQPGDTWEQSLDSKLPNLGAMKVHRTFKYEGPDKVGERPTARITVAMEMSFDLELEQMGVKVSGTLKTVRGQGTAHFDPEAGRLLSYRATTELTGELNVNVGDMAVPVQTQQTQTTTVQLLDELPE
jgi:hypothetical protein